MAAPVLNDEQKAKVVEWLIAGFPEPLIRQLFLSHGWEPIQGPALHHYRAKHRQEIEARLQARMDAAYDAGLAQREARVRALNDHAGKLAELMWLPDDKGKLHNEKAWRETLDDIAKEMGHRRLGIDWAQSFGKMTDAELDEYIATAERRIAAGREGDPRGALAGSVGDDDPGE